MNTKPFRLVDSIEALEARIAPAAATLNLSSLNGRNGSQISGVAEYDYSGIAVSGAGDINGDGIDDLVIGAHGVDANGDSSGAVYVLFGKSGGLGANLNLVGLNGTNGFKVLGETAGDRFGYAVSSAGDLNGDGLDDLIVGAPQASPNGSGSGAAYVVFGRISGFPAEFNTATFDGTAGFKINGASAGDQAGGSISAAGDVNGDGLDDVVIGAAGADGEQPGSGASYVIFGSLGTPAAAVELSNLDGANGFKVAGEGTGDGSGFAVSGAGDVNGDGFADIIIGAPTATANAITSGASYILYGSLGGFAATIGLSSLDGSNGFKINGESEDDQFGTAVSGAGDVNGDGFADYIIGAPRESAHDEYAGASYVIFGRRAVPGAALNAGALTGLDGFKLLGENDGDYSGMVVSGAGDVNGDGLSDVIVGAYGSDVRGDYSGASYVVFGKALGFPADLRLSSVNGHNGFQINGEQAEDYAGSSVHGVGDVNGDGVDDLVIGAPGASLHGTSSGASYVVYGQADPNAPVTNSVVVQEPDGDMVTITLDGNWLTPRDIKLAPDGSIESIDLTRMATGAQQAFGAKPMNLTIAVKSPIGGTGDGLTKIGMINAKGLGLGKVVLEGSLGQIFAGDGSGKNAIQSLIVQGDLGSVNGTPQATKLLGGLKKLLVGGSLQPDVLDIDGFVKVVAVRGDFGADFPTGGALASARTAEGAAQGLAAAPPNPFTGGTLVAKTIGSLKVGGSIKQAAVNVTSGLGNVSIFGDLLGGGFFSGGNIQSVKVRGQISGDASGHPATVMARNGIDRLIINGDVENAHILAGYNKDGEAVNPDAQIGRIVVKGDWIRSSLVAGIADSTGDGFGQNDTVISGDNDPSIISKIANVVIRGTASGSATPGDHFGIVAQEIGRVSIGGVAINLQPDAPDNVLIDTTNGDFRLVEVI